ncbi:MAG: LON peptidase substrate-binding domain-containing protein [Verrucomicrobiaceae bacterium]
MSGLTIPDKCGVILLPDTVLFPHGAIPLHIFEPRYRQMIAEALEGDCLFCVGNLIGSDDHDPENHVAQIGTIGLIRSSREAPDGTSNLILHGVFRVKFEKWFDDKPYPHAHISPVPNTTLEAAEEKTYLARLRAAVNGALSKFPQPVHEQINQVLDRAGDAATCADAIAQQFIHDPNDRQRLLATPEVRQRLDFIIRFLKKAGEDDIPF